MDKNIFKYHNGERELFGDPLAIERKLRLAMGTKAAKVVDVANDEESEDVAWALATGKIIDAVRSAFQMVPFDNLTGKGATDSRCQELWDGFLEWMEKKSAKQGS